MLKKFFFIFLLGINLNSFSKELKIVVTDKELNIPLEGVKVTVTKGGYTGFTDENGNFNLRIDDSITQTSIVATLAGYESKKMVVSDFTKPIVVKMAIQGVLEGKELVIESRQIGKKDEEVGVSKVIDKEEMKSTALIGQIEDVMSTIKVLPGVSYSGKFNANFSVRGGEPNDLTAIYEGFVIRFPYHWGRAFSIFNPHAVDSMKFSTGIFSAKIGPAASAALEVNYINPDKGFHFYYNTATQTQEALFQIPVGLKNAGLLIGGRVTFLDLPMFIASGELAKQGVTYNRIPYIYDVYLKWFWEPNKRFKWYLNGFFGSDGIGMVSKSENILDSNNNVIGKRDIVPTFDFKWYNYDTFVFNTFKILPTDKFYINCIFGYEYLTNLVDGKFIDEGKRSYNDDFKNFITGLNLLTDGDPRKEFYRTILDTYNNQTDKNSYYINNKSSFKSRNELHSIQTKIDFENQLHDKVNFEYGFGGTFDFLSYEEKDKIWQPFYENGTFVLKPFEFEAKKSDKKVINYHAFFNFNFNIIPDVLKIETGCRVEHEYFFIDNDYSLTTYPIVSPRLNITYTPVKNLQFLKAFSISAGVGLFSKQPFESLAIKKEWDIKN
ncbi:MAG TPA: TonB-dependent receptor plug domain-containing protein, partial [Spirochaetota bacterium]|nr:TonB-dependent receptor plug domain-containing protein [Spirochaetota bacterium]